MVLGLLKYLPLSPSATASALKHKAQAFSRRLMRKDPLIYFRRLEAQGHPVQLIDENGSARCCHICGFVLARVSIVPGWTAQACSASDHLRNILTNSRFKVWAEQAAQKPVAAPAPASCLQSERP